MLCTKHHGESFMHFSRRLSSQFTGLHCQWLNPPSSTPGTMRNVTDLCGWIALSKGDPLGYLNM